MDIINNIYDEEPLSFCTASGTKGGFAKPSKAPIIAENYSNNVDYLNTQKLQGSIENDLENIDSLSDTEMLDTSWIQESERYHHISDNQERELMDSIGFYFIYINKHDYIEKILFEKGVLETDTENGFSFLSKETILKIIQNKKISTPTSKYKLIDILSFVVDIEPNKVKEFLEMDTFDSDLEKIFLKVLPIFNDIHINKSIFVFHSINHLYFIFQEVQHSSNHRTTLKSILKYKENKEDLSSHRSVEAKLDVLQNHQVAQNDDSQKISIGDRMRIPENLVVDQQNSVKSVENEVENLPPIKEVDHDKPTNKGTKKVRIVDNIRELRKLSNKRRFTRKVF